MSSLRKHVLGGVMVLAAAAASGAITPAAADPVNGNSRDCSVPTTVTEHNFFGSTKHMVLNISGPKSVILKMIDLGNIPSGGEVTVNCTRH